MDKKKLTIINAFPKDQRRIDILEEQIDNLKQLDWPILLISGCEAPSFIVEKVNYYVLNKDNEILDKDFTLLLKDLNSSDAPFLYFTFYEYEVSIYTTNVNCTISKNIKLGFDLAKSLGYESVFYTEDDNIFSNTALNWINNNLSFLNGELPYKIATVTGPQSGAGYNMAFTTFFFADVDYFIEKFKIPINKKDWYNSDNILKYNLDKIFEGTFYDLLKNDLDKVLNIEESFLNQYNKGHIKWGITNRFQTENFHIENLFNLIPDLNGNKYLFFYNWSNLLLEGEKSYNIKILYNNEIIDTANLAAKSYWYVLKIPNNLVDLKLIINDSIEKQINTDLEVIKNNGLMIINERS